MESVAAELADLLWDSKLITLGSLADFVIDVADKLGVSLLKPVCEFVLPDWMCAAL